MSVLVEFSMTPIGKGESVSEYVARSLEIIDKSGVPYRLGPMGTCLEGEWDAVFGVIRDCYQLMRQDCPRISCTIKVDAREGRDGRLRAKVARVQQLVGRKLDE
jgi:uncharacterized protein (TIGR00106 family)